MGETAHIGKIAKIGKAAAVKTPNLSKFGGETLMKLWTFMGTPTPNSEK